MKKFKGFTNQQTHTLLKEMGFTGPAQKDEMDAFLASSPRAAAKIGRYTDIARQRVEGEPLAPSGFAEGSSINAEVVEKERQRATRGSKPVSRITYPGQLIYDIGEPELPKTELPKTEIPETELPETELPETEPPETTQKPDFILKQGTETPEVTEAATGLDEAQKAYSTSMGALTDAQLALSGACRGCV
mgnify:FL=1